MSTPAAAAIAAGVCVLAAPYLARLTVSVPDNGIGDWWRGRPAGTGRVAVTAVVGAGLGALAGTAAGTTPLIVPLLALALVGAPLVVIDQELHRLPNRLVFTLAVVAPVLAAGVALHDGEWHRFARAAGGAVAVFVILFLPRLASPGSFGYGDTKLGSVLGGYLGWFGWFYVVYGIVAGFVLCALIAVVLLATGRADRKTPIPLGPSLLTGALLTLAFDLVPQVS